MNYRFARIALTLCVMSLVVASCGGHTAALPTNATHGSVRLLTSCTTPTNNLSPAKNAGGSTTPSASFTGTPTVGDLLVAGVQVSNISLVQFSDPGWTRIQTPSGGGELLVVEYHYVTTADTGTFTWSLANNQPWAVAIQDLTCTATSSPIDASSSTYFGSNTGGTTSTITGHVSDLPVALFGISKGTETDTPRSPWTEQAFKTETPLASISLQNNLPLTTVLTATGGDTWSVSGANSGAVLLVKPLVMPAVKRVTTDAFTENSTKSPTLMCPWTTIAEDSNTGNEGTLDAAGCIAQLYTNPTRQAVDDPNCKNYYTMTGVCPDSIFAHNASNNRLEKGSLAIFLLAMGGTSTCAGGLQSNNNAQGATIAAMENAYLLTRNSHLETPFFDTPTPFGLHPENGMGTSFPCGYTTNAEWYAQYLSMINAVSTPGIINGASCSDPSDCPDQTIDGVMYLLSSPNVVGILKEDCMNEFGTTNPPSLTTWQETVSTAIKVRTGGSTYFGGNFPAGKFYVCRGTTNGFGPGTPQNLPLRYSALATFWLTYDESTGNLGPETGVPHSIYSSPWYPTDGFTVLPESGFVCTGPVKSDAQINSFADLAVLSTGAYAREWNSCSLWTGPSGSQTSDGPCAAISVPGTASVAWSSVLPGLQNGLRYTRSLVLTGDDPLASPPGTATFTGAIPSVIQASSGIMVCQS